MTIGTRVASELATALGLVPVVYLGVRHAQRRRSGVAWWWLAAAFAVSWLADMAALWADPDLVGNLYPITQAALIGAVFLDRLEAAQFAIALVMVAVVAVLWRGPLGIDVLLRTVAWGAVVAIAWDRPALGRVRVALVVTFGVGLLCWWGYAVRPGWWSWGTYQVVRAAGIACFCWAATRPLPRFRISRRLSP